MENELLYKNRSTSSCIQAAYKLLVSNMGGFFRATWFPVMLSSIFMAVLMVLNLPNPQAYAIGSSHMTLYAIISLVSLIGFLVCSVWASARLITMLNGQKFRLNAIRVVLLSLNLLLIYALVYGLTLLAAYIAMRFLHCSLMTLLADNWLIVLGWVVVFSLLSLPFLYISIRYLVGDKAHFWHGLPTTYGTGLRRMGFIFLTAFITSLLIGVISMLLMLPMTILLFANAFSTIGVMTGDPSGMPGYFLILLGVTMLITFFVMWFVWIFEFLVYYFMYGSIEKQREERRTTALAIINDNEEIFTP